MQLNFITEDRHTIEAVQQFLDEWNSDSLVITTYTSGSTGKPKEIKLKKEYMIASAKMTGVYLGLSKNDSALLCLSPNTIAGKMMIVRSLVLELNLSIGDISSRPLKQCESGFDFIAMVPMQLETSIREDRNKIEESSKIIIGGAPASDGLIEMIDKLEVSVYHTFGMTETISHIAMRNLSDHDTEYEALPGVAISIHEGVMAIDAPHLGVTGLTTNDVIEQPSESTFIWKGRKDFVINSGGVKLHPEAIEKQLSKIISHPLFVAGLEDTYLGNKVVLCIESTIETDLKKSEITEVLNSFEIPKEIFTFEKFERTESNKINRNLTLDKIASAKKQVL